MGRPRRIIGLALALAAVAAPAAAAAVKPHLVPLLPTAASSDRQAPVFVDALQQPGRLLYRFDAVVANTGGALDLFAPGPSSAAAANEVRQAVWDDGAPDAMPQDPNASPAGAAGVAVSALGPGATLRFAPEPGHGDWRIPGIADYALLVPGQPDRTSPRTDLGVCPVDSYGPLTPGATRFYPEGWTGADPDPHHTWCQPLQSPLAGGADPALVRGGISPGWGAIDAAQDAGQWIDVTGLAPGAYTLRATVDPGRHLDASPPDGGDDVLSVERVVPGVTAADASVQALSGRAVDVGLSGAVVGPEVPARAGTQGPCADGALSPATPLASCYRSADHSGPLSFAVASGPEHGTVAIGAGAGLRATATYTPAAGYAGPDAFAYTATDARGLTSAPATVSVSVASAPTAPTAVVATVSPRIVMPHRLSQVKRLAVTVRLGGTVCGARVAILGTRMTRHPAPYHPLAARRVGCASKVHLTARRPRAGTWRVRAVVIVSGRSFVSPVRRVIVSPPDPAGPSKSG